MAQGRYARMSHLRKELKKMQEEESKSENQRILDKQKEISGDFEYGLFVTFKNEADFCKYCGNSRFIFVKEDFSAYRGLFYTTFKCVKCKTNKQTERKPF